MKHNINILSSEKDVSLPTAVVGLYSLLGKIESIMDELDDKEQKTQEDEIMISLLKKGKDKLMKHYSKCNKVFCILLILDPRFESAGFDSVEWGREIKKPAINMFKKIYMRDDYI